MAIPAGTILPLLKTVFFSILQVFLLCLAGYILAGKGILDKKTQKQLNKLNVSLFTPALLFSKVAFFLTPAKLVELWIIPILFIIVTLLSMGVAFSLGWLFGLKRSQRSFAMAASMFMNSNSLPIALMQSLVVTVPGLKWGKDDSKNAMLGRALTYLVVYSTLGQVVRWSYGVQLLTQADKEPSLDIHSEVQPLLGSNSDDSDSDDEPLHHSNTTPFTSSTFTAEPEDIGAPLDNPPKPNYLRPATKRNSTFFRSFPNSPNQSRAHLPAIPSETTIGDETDDIDTTLPTLARGSRTKHKWFRKLWARAKRIYIGFIDFMTVPLWAALASLIVACIQPLQHTLDVHLSPIKGALAQAGNCSIPVTLVVLGGYFYPEKGGHKDVKRRQRLSFFASLKEMFGFGKPRLQRSASEIRASNETKTVIIGIVSRMFLVPMLMLPLMALAAYFDYQEVFADPVFVVSNVLLISSPPALTLAQITQAASGDSFERLISRTIFWSYCIVTPPATIIYVVLGMTLAKL